MKDQFPFKTLLVCMLIGALMWAAIISAFAQQSDLGKLLDGYRVTPGKIAVWTGFGIAGAMWGSREAYHADLRVFEKKFGVDEFSFFGSQAWQRNYVKNRYRNADGSLNGHKPEWGNTFRDVWHFNGAASRAIWVTGTFTIGAGKQKMKHKLIDMLIGSAVSSTAGWASYNYLRYW